MQNIVHGRSDSIDLLRFIGLSLIILAHVAPPFVLFNLRCFDVPMMLFVSGLAYSNHKADFSPSFFVRRMLRLIVPVYMFLTAYFLIVIILRYAAGIDFGIRWQHIADSYLLLDGIGFVWIIRIFLLIGLLTPVLMTIERAVHSDAILLLILAAVSTIMTVAIRHGFGVDNFFICNYLYYAIGYSIPFIAGLRVGKMNLKRLAIFSSLVFLVLASSSFMYVLGGGNLLNINVLKYPPQAYFLFYGLFMSLVCHAVCCHTCLVRHVPALCRFIGMNTIWIYLYHIPLIQITGILSLPWWLRYVAVYAVSVAVTYVQIRIVNRLRLRYDSAIYKYLKG